MIQLLSNAFLGYVLSGVIVMQNIGRFSIFEKKQKSIYRKVQDFVTGIVFWPMVLNGLITHMIKAVSAIRSLQVGDTIEDPLE